VLQAMSAWPNSRIRQLLVCVTILNYDLTGLTQLGPFGGAIAFTQSAGAKKRAIEFNLRKRRFARALAKKELTIEELEALAEESDLE
jgi:hypothetical protein